MYFASSGSVAPINIVGSASVTSETISVSAALSSDRSPRNGVSNGVHTDHFERNSVIASDTTLTLNSSPA